MSASTGVPALPEPMRAAVEQAMRAGNFFVAPPRRLRIEHHECVDLPWEVYRGHLLEGRHVRQVVRFASWQVLVDDETPATVPLVTLLWQADNKLFHVTRHILTHGFEAYEDSPGVILSRPAQKWLPELIGTIAAERFGGDALEAELSQSLFLAVIGTSRLPITSLETPLPAFSLGQLAYLPRLDGRESAWTDPLEFLRAALDDRRSTFECAKALETALRASLSEAAKPPVAPPAAGPECLGAAEYGSEVLRLARALEEQVSRRASGSDWLARLFRAVFNTAALSPYNDFAERMVAVIVELASRELIGSTWGIDTIGYMLRHLCRHLTAFDLTLFHNFGANYPDALFLDLLLAGYLRLVEEHPELILGQEGDAPGVVAAKRSRRRALRQACLVRSAYEGHRVPDAPTSMGENARVLPAPFIRVPEEQILEASKRRRILFEGRPTASLLGETGRRALDASLADLDQARELVELGMAVFLDRPLGIFKEPGEVDRTPLVSYEAFSRSIAARRLARCKSAGWISAERHTQLVALLENLPPQGLTADQVAALERPGVVSLADARKAAPDFVFLRTTRGSLNDLLAHYDLSELAAADPTRAEWLQTASGVLLVQHGASDKLLADAGLRAYDREGELTLELGFEIARGQGPRYCERGGVELVERLRVLSFAGLPGGVCLALR